MGDCEGRPGCKEFMESFRERLADHDLLVEKVLWWWETHSEVITWYDGEKVNDEPLFVTIAKRIRRAEG